MRRLILFLTLVVAAAIAAPSGSGEPGRLRLQHPPQGSSAACRSRRTDRPDPAYDGLTPLQGDVRRRDIRRLFLGEDFRSQRRDHGRRDRPAGAANPARQASACRIHGDTRADVWFGAGYVTAQDRSLLLTLGRGRPPRSPRSPA